MIRLTGAVFLIILMLTWVSPPEVEAQAVAFQPVVTPFNDGVTLTTTPVVSADRRYVRLGVNVGFNTINGVNAFSFPAAAVSGGGFGGLGGFGGMGGFGSIGLGAVGPVNNYGFGYAPVNTTTVTGAPFPYYAPYTPTPYPLTYTGLGLFSNSIQNAIAPRTWRRTFP